MQFASTRNPDIKVDFREGVFQGLAPDGGLYHPVTMPDLTEVISKFGPGTTFLEIATEMTKGLFGDELTDEQAERICTKAFTFSPALVKVTDKISILELYHGPSCAFKDFGASYLAACMEEFLKSRSSKAIILTATSGDTGSAVARAFHKRENIEVIILYPSGRVSPLQEKQLTTLGENITALEVKGSFDDCQRMVKSAFVDPELIGKMTLSSANSINLGRLIPQSFYYLWANSRDQAGKTKPYFAVPSGNFGNLTAGVMASKWGMKTPGFLAVTNRNDVVPEYLKTGDYNPRPSEQTLSNAMDVGAPSNFDRLLAIFKGDWDKMKETIGEEVVTDKETLETIKRIQEDYNYLADPHTAVGFLGAERYLEKNADIENIICLSTAHPGKFLEVVQEATGSFPELPEQLKAIQDLEKVSIITENTDQALKDFLLARFA
ncbi:MAG: threonine synthase [Spirochaetales bacterium]|nr:threonine synthase [Spirochaetales bacterium]